MIDVQRVDFVTVATRDRAERFYAETLGLRGNGILLHHRYAPYRDKCLP